MYSPSSPGYSPNPASSSSSFPEKKSSPHRQPPSAYSPSAFSNNYSPYYQNSSGPSGSSAPRDALQDKDKNESEEHENKKG